MKENKYTISEAARLLSVENHVLRYWEEELELKIPRNELGHRYYREEEIQLLHCIKELKNKGFQLKAVKEVLPDLEQKKLIDIHKLLTTQEELENQELEQLEQVRQKEITQREEVQREDIQKENRRKEIEEKNKNIKGLIPKKGPLPSCIIKVYSMADNTAISTPKRKGGRIARLMISFQPASPYFFNTYRVNPILTASSAIFILKNNFIIIPI